MRIVISLLASCAVLFGCSAGAEGEKNSPYEDENSPGARMMGAAFAYEKCLQEQAKKLDDGVSDAGTIGAEVWSACRSYGYKFAGAYWHMPGIAFSERVLLWVTMFTQGKDAGTTRVLKVRSEAKQ